MDAILYGPSAVSSGSRRRRSLPTRTLMMLLFSALLLGACNKPEELTDPDSAGSLALRKFHFLTDYTQVNLISDVPEYGGALIDSNLVNAWGIAFGPTGGIWVSATEKGLSTIYSQTGSILRPPVIVPSASGLEGGEPTGQVFNATTDFVIPSTGQVSRFIFATENGTIAAWASGNVAVTVADRSIDHAIYKGLEMIQSEGAWYLAATDFYNGRIDLFDHNFAFVTSSRFADPSIPAGFAPFNLRVIGDKVYVTYAKQEAPDNEDDEPGAGNGYVNIFDMAGNFISRFTSQGTLNSPWGIELLKTNNGFEIEEEADDDGEENTMILIGNFGDGRISAFDSQGNFVDYLRVGESPVEIEGLWAISYVPQGNASYKDARNRIYFTAGPDDEEHGLFGYLSRK